MVNQDEPNKNVDINGVSIGISGLCARKTTHGENPKSPPESRRGRGGGVTHAGCHKQGDPPVGGLASHDPAPLPDQPGPQIGQVSHKTFEDTLTH